MGGQENRRVRLFGQRIPSRGRHLVHLLDAEIDGQSAIRFCRNAHKIVPCSLDRLSIDGIVRAFGDVGFVCNDCGVWIDIAPGAVEPAEALPQGVNRSRFCDERVEIDIHAGLDALRGDEDQRLVQGADFAVAPSARTDRLQFFNEVTPIHRPGRPDHQDEVERVAGRTIIRDISSKFLLK